MTTFLHLSVDAGPQRQQFLTFSYRYLNLSPRLPLRFLCSFPLESEISLQYYGPVC